MNKLRYNQDITLLNIEYYFQKLLTTIILQSQSVEVIVYTMACWLNKQLITTTGQLTIDNNPCISAEDTQFYHNLQTMNSDLMVSLVSNYQTYITCLFLVYELM